MRIYGCIFRFSIQVVKFQGFPTLPHLKKFSTYFYIYYYLIFWSITDNNFIVFIRKTYNNIEDGKILKIKIKDVVV